MYEEFYGFTQPPFSLAPDPRFLYRSESHDVALQQVWQAIRRKEGFITLTGDVGTGKTTLCRTLLEHLEPTAFAALVLAPLSSLEELLREVLVSFGVVSREPGHGRLAAAGKDELVRTLHQFLHAVARLQGSAVLIIDDAHQLSPQLLEEIRSVSSSETDDRKPLQVVLAGEQNLLAALQDPTLRHLDQRLSTRATLKALTRDEVDAYITHRLWVARGATTVSFAPGAVSLAHSLSGGVPRTINRLCDRALVSGAAARTQTITEELMSDAATILELQAPTSGRGQRLRRRAGTPTRAIASVIIVLLALLGASLYFVGNPAEALQVGSQPRVAPVPAQNLGVRPLAAPPIPESLPLVTLPTLANGFFSVLIDTYAAPREAARAEAILAAKKLPYYGLDLRYLDGRRRRVLVGRYRTRTQAEEVRAQLASDFANARVVTAATEWTH